MADHHLWLEALQRATNYRELQSVFSQMAAYASASNNASDLAASLDEAIRRIEQERSRDSLELEKFASEYDSFKQEQSGVIGWFKRKLPFTETRKQELQHRGAVSQQKAEILADNFVIARAQMLKERILPSRVRRMGNRPNDWREKLMQHESIQEIRPYSMVTMDLGNELIQSKGFVEKVRIEIEAFSDADFADKEDRSMRDMDLLTARAELKSLEDETRENETLRKTALKRIATLIHNELATNDPSFQTISLRSDQLKEIVDELSKAMKIVDERRATLATLVEKLIEVERIPEQHEALENEERKMRREFDDAEHCRSRAATDLVQPTYAYDSAAREASQAITSLNAAKSKRDIRASQQETAEVTTEFEYGAISPEEAEYERQKSIATQANEALRRVEEPFHIAKRKLEKATKDVDSIRKKLDQHAKDLDSLSEKQSRLRKLVGSIHDTIQRSSPDFQRAVQHYSGLLSQVTWLENQRFLVGVPKEILYENTNRDILPSSPSWTRSPGFTSKSRELTEFQQQSAALEMFLKSIKSDNDLLQKAYSQIVATRKDALKQRCHLLIDSILANEIVFD